MPDDARAVTLAAPSTAVAVHHEPANMLSDSAAFEHGWRVAKLFASSQLIPAHLRDKPADCFIALHMARELRENPVVVMQNIYIVSGKAGWSATYMIGRANRSGVFKGRITWQSEGAGEKLVVTARATLADTGEVVQAEASMAMAKAEGWTKNSKYTSMPEHMLRWRSATMLIRLYAPEVMLGIPTSDELEDMGGGGRVVDVTATDETIERDAFEQAASGKTIEYDETTGEIHADQNSPAAGGNPADAQSSERAPAPGKTDAAAPPDSPTGGASTKGAPQERQQPKRDEDFFAGDDLEIPAPRGEDRKPDWHGWGARMVALIEVAKAGELEVLRSHNLTSRQRCLGAADPKIVAAIDAAFDAAEKRSAR